MFKQRFLEFIKNLTPRKIAYSILGIGGLLLASLALMFFLSTSDLPDVGALKNYRPSLTTTVFSRDGVLMAELAEENRYLVEPSTLPSHVVWAFISSEDGNFYEHKGLDWQGIMRAALNNLVRARVAQGGSTITQQVAKSLLLSPERSLRRKMREAVLAVRMEQNLTKDEILKLYLNHIYLGHGAYGVEAAARVYFGVKSEKLSIAQAALLAGLPQAPSAYDPYRNPEEALKRRAYVLEQMLKEKRITRAQYDAAGQERLVLANSDNFFKKISPHFTEQVRRELDARYGSAEVLKGGMKIVATMDSRLQKAAQKALRNGLEAFDKRQGYRGALRHQNRSDTAAFDKGNAPEPDSNVEALVTDVRDDGLSLLSRGMRFTVPAEELYWAVGEGRSPKRLFTAGDVVLARVSSNGRGGLTATVTQTPTVEGALVCLDAHTGEVLAAVGGYNFEKSQFNRVTQAKRQAGSAIKPLIFGAAVEKGLTPAYVVYDSPIVFDTAGLEEKWKPKNYSDKFYGPTTLREALVHSRNLVTIKVVQDIGLSHTIDFLRRTGLTTELNPELSLALGACSVTPLELASAYGVYATMGYRHKPAFLLSVTDRDGRVLEEFRKPYEITPDIDPRVAYVVNNMMQAVIQEGTGGRARGLPVPSAGKTGTTNDSKDAWFIGVTPNLITAVWVGNDDNTTIGDGETGGAVAAPIWKEFMDRAVVYYNSGDFSMPPGIEFAQIDTETGGLATGRSKKSFSAAFLAGTAPGRTRTIEVEDSRGGKSTTKAFDADDPGAMDALR